MMRKSILSVTLILFTLALFGFNNGWRGIEADSLVLSKEDGSRDVIITNTQKIKVWREKKIAVTGYFESFENGTLILNRGSDQIAIGVNEIESIKLISKSFKNLIGAGFILAGGTAMALGGISLIAGLAALSSDSLGAVILVAVPVLAGGGFGILKLGQGLSGRKYDMDRWVININ